MTIEPEYIGYLAGTLTTLSFWPQAIKTITSKDTSSLSLGMYSLFTTGVLCWLIYGIIIENMAIIIPNLITLLLASVILSYKIYHTVCGQKQP